MVYGGIDMKFQGKIAPWFWAILIMINALFLECLWSAIMSDEKELSARITVFVIVAVCVLVPDIILIPVIVKNYVMLSDESLTIVCGLGKGITIPIRDIVEVYETHNPIASSAASLDRIFIQGRMQDAMCSVKEKARFLEELKKANPKIVFR